MPVKSDTIAFICPRLASGGAIGGAETLIRNLASRAGAAGRHVRLLTTCARDHFTWKNERPPGTQTIDGLEVECFPVDDDRDETAFHLIQSSIGAGRDITADEEATWLRNSVNSRAMLAHLKAHAAHYRRLVVGPYLFGLTHAVARSAPQKTLLLPCLHDEAFARLRVVKDLFRTVPGMIFNSEPERDLAGELYEVRPDQRLHVVGMGLDPFDASSDAFRTAHGIEGPYLLYCGRREPLKGTPLLIDYFTTFRARTGRDLRLVLTGSGPIEAPPEAAASIVDCGFVSEDDKHAAMAGALVFCHPSVNESLSIVLLESWLAGTPAMVHARSRVLRYQCARAEGGLWFRTYPEFEESLLMLMDQPALRTALGRSGQSFTRREYAWETVVPRLLEALDA